MRDPITGLVVRQIPAAVSALYKATLVDATGTVVQPTVLTLSLVDLRTGAIIAGRRNMNVLNAAGGEVLDGQPLASTTPSELPLLDRRLDYEDHVAIFRFVAAEKPSRHAFVMRVTPW